MTLVVPFYRENYLQLLNNLLVDVVRSRYLDLTTRVILSLFSIIYFIFRTIVCVCVCSTSFQGIQRERVG